VAKGYAEGPAAEEAERRREEMARGRRDTGQPRELRPAVFGSTSEDESSHFLGWRDELDPDELFDSGRAWGLSVRKVPA
jgi:hypothetical protein